MKIGVLQADELDTDVIEQFGSHFDMVQQLLQPIDNSLKFRKYQTTQLEFPENIDECDAYIIPGSKFSVYENLEWINRLKQCILNLHQSRKKLIGICFGHQLIAQTLGGLTENHATGWGAGIMSSHVTQQQDWMRPQKNNFSLVVSHQDQVARMPPGAELIAENDFCAISGFRLGENIITFQGHPEFTNDYLKSILARRQDAMGDQVYQQALATADNSTDRAIIAQWMINFIKA